MLLKYCDLCGIGIADGKTRETYVALLDERYERPLGRAHVCDGCANVIMSAYKDTLDKLCVQPQSIARLPHATQCGQPTRQSVPPVWPPPAPDQPR